MTALRIVCQTFLCVLIVVTTYASGQAFMTHRWDAAAGYGGLMLSACHILIVMWARQSSPAGRHTYNARSRKR